MARANFVKAAQKDIYQRGASVTYISKKGKRAGQKLSKTDRTVPADKNDKVIIAKGESYYWWQFKNSAKQFSKTPPKRSQLTRSAYLSAIYDIEDRIGAMSANDADDLSNQIEDIKGELENLKDETEGSLDNMPDSLKESPTGQLLQERIDALDNAISEFEGIDCDYEEPDEEELKDELGDDCTEEEMESLKEDKLQEWLSERIDEIQNISLSC